MTIIKIESNQANVPQIVKSAIWTEIKRLEIGLSRTEKEIRGFEDKYRVDSETFLKRYTAEDLSGQDEEYIRWAGELRIRERILEDLGKLKEIEYVSV
jgi:hypothetical protein